MEAQQTQPEFREPTPSHYSVGDEFHWTHESHRCGIDYVDLSGVVVEKHDNRLEVDVGGSNYYEISTTGKVVSISDNHKRSMVGYCVYP